MQELKWWQHAVVYQIYPRSFQDSNGDGVGDLNGIRSRLEYLVELGADAVWISPIYPSPMADFGYDVANYCGIDKLFGTMEDFDLLLAEVHRRGLKMILDFVPNHTSDRHPWFLESRSSRANAKRDWYIWRDRPNNWLSHFGGSAWEFDERTGQYYLHSFLKQQPDLNWRNPEVKAAMFDALRFWLDKGVDGFRVDVMWLMIKDDQFRDNPPNPGYRPGEPSKHRLLPVYDADQPENHALVAEMRGVIDAYHDRVLIGEIYLPVQKLVSYYGKDGDGANLPFNFQLLQCAWSAEAVARAISEYNDALPSGAWPNWVLGNHDQPRMASRVGVKEARVAAMLLMTLPGTLTIYYGEELGMRNVAIAPDQVQDPAEKNEPGIGQGRDPERTPMPWDGSPKGRFTTGVPWLPLGEEHVTVNVEALRGDAHGMLEFYRRLIALRREHAVLVSGMLSDVAAQGAVLRYIRGSEKERVQVVLNMSHYAARAEVATGVVMMGTHAGSEGKRVAGITELGAAEGIVIAME
jgi:alpha-glucosidase